MLQFSLLLDTWLENLEHIACWSLQLKVSQLCKNSRCLFVNITFSAHKFIQQQFIATYLSCLLEVLPASCCLCHKLHLHYLFQDACIWHTPITTKADNKLYAHIQRQFHSHGVGNVQGRGCTIDNIVRKYIIYGCTLKGKPTPPWRHSIPTTRVSTRMHVIVTTTNIATSTVFDLLVSCLRIERCNHQKWVELLSRYPYTFKGQVTASQVYG